MDIILPVLIVAAIGLIAGLGLALASKFMAVPTDERQEKIRECLPGANCGACGYTGCDGYAAALAEGAVSADKCAPGGETTAKALADILGVQVDVTPRVAFIACAGTMDTAKTKFLYEGLKSCSAANLVQRGPLMCEFGCIGFGDCAAACPFGAIEIQNGRPIVCKDICSGCGKCAAACPKGLISILPKNTEIKVACSNKHKGANVVKVCSSSCIACGLCERACESGAISVKDNLAVIDYTLCTSCGKCREVCKRKAII